MPRDVFTKFDHADQRYLVDLVRHVILGERTVKNNGELYLPKPEGMTQQGYNAFRARAPFLSVPRYTLDLMMGKVFRKDTIFELPDKLKDRLPFVDSGRYDFQWGARRAMREVLSVGRIGFLLDPDISGPIDEVNIVVLEDEALLEVQTVNNVLVGVKLRLDDCEEDEHWRLWIGTDDGQYRMQKIGTNGSEVGDEITPSILGQTLPYIPLTVINPRTFDASCPERPPMADLAQKTVYMYQLAAEYRQALHFVASPQPFCAGFRPDEVPDTISPSTIWSATNPAAKAMIISYSGEGLSEIRTALEMTKSELASMGASMLLPKVTGVQAARTLELKDAEESSFVVEVSEMVSDGLERVIRMMAEWERTDAADISVEINRDVVSTKIDPRTIEVLHKAVLSGSLSHDTFIENLKRGEIVPAERTPQDERDLIGEGELPDVESNETA